MQAEGKLPEGTPKRYPSAVKAYGIIVRCLTVQKLLWLHLYVFCCCCSLSIGGGRWSNFAPHGGCAAQGGGLCNAYHYSSCSDINTITMYKECEFCHRHRKTGRRVLRGYGRALAPTSPAMPSSTQLSWPATTRSAGRLLAFVSVCLLLTHVTRARCQPFLLLCAPGSSLM